MPRNYHANRPRRESFFKLARYPTIDDVYQRHNFPTMATKTMNISLTPELKASIERRVRSGRYRNASDVVRLDCGRYRARR